MAPLPDGMAETGHRERDEMRRAARSRKNKFDLGAREPDGSYRHICRYSSKEEAEEARERLTDPDPETRALIGLPEEYTLEIIPT